MAPARESTAHLRRNAVSAEIRALMGRHRVTQTELAHWLGIGQSSLSERLNGRVPWDIDDLNGIAERFGVEVATLFAPPPAHNPRYGNYGHVLTKMSENPLIGHLATMMAPALETVKG